MALHALSPAKRCSRRRAPHHHHRRLRAHQHARLRRELLERQAQSIGLPLHEVRIPPQCVNPIYEARMEAALHAHFDRGVRQVAFGDIFLEDLRAYREGNLARIGMTALFPIWKRDTRDLIREFQADRFRAIAVCTDPKILAPSFAGRELGKTFFRDLSPYTDPRGENGEFHTFVFDGPITFVAQILAGSPLNCEPDKTQEVR